MMAIDQRRRSGVQHACRTPQIRYEILRLVRDEGGGQRVKDNGRYLAHMN